MSFHDWLVEKLREPEVISAILAIDDTFGQISELPYCPTGEKSIPSEEYYSEPNYQNFIHILISSCYFALKNEELGCGSEVRKKNKYLDYLIDGEGRCIRKSIEEVISFNRRHSFFSGSAFHRAIMEMRKTEKVFISGPMHSSNFYLEDILNYYLKYLLMCTSGSIADNHTSANLFFPKPITREFKQPIVDGLAYQLAYLFKDWHGAKKALAWGDLDGFEMGILQKGGNSHPALIASLINAFLELDTNVTKEHIQTRLKELRKLDASIGMWPNFIDD